MSAVRLEDLGRRVRARALATRAGHRRRNHSRTRGWRADKMPSAATTRMVMSETGHIGWCPLAHTGMTTARTTVPRTSL
jgi:hypothetical protein